MKIKSFILSALAMSLALVGCSKKEEPISDIIVTVDPASISIDESAQDKAVSLKATRAWKAVINYEGDETGWVTVTPERGDASNSEQTVTITAKANAGRDRVAKIKFNIGLDDATLTVTQKGPGGSSDPVYFNDFDKSAAVKDGNNWPYVYQSDCWKNERGTGIGTLEYITDGNKATVRNNSNSTGSGVNNWFFGKAPAFFCAKKLTLPEMSNYTLSCLAIRNVYGAEAGGSVFDHSQFKLYVSNDGKKWVELEYHFSNGDPDNAWDLLESTFTVPAGTGTLCIGIPTPSEASTYRIDDLKLDVAAAPGASIDFSKGIEISEFAGGGGGGSTQGEPKGTGTEADPFNPTAAIAKAIEIGQTASEEYYYIKGFVATVKEINTQFGNATFEITDTKAYDTEKFTCYRVKYIGGADFTSTDQIKVGDEVVVKAQLMNYKGNTPETNNGEVVSHNGDTPGPVGDLETESVAEVLKASKGTNIKLKNALVVANAKTGYLVTDSKGADYVFVFEDKNPTEEIPAVGSKVDISCVMDAYSGMPQLKTPSTTVTATGAVFSYPEPEDITSTLGSFTSNKVKYVSFSGNLTIDSSKGYYNVAVPGSEVMGAFLPPSNDVSAFAGVDNITYTGYYIYTTGSGKYVYLILTDAHPCEGDYFSVAPASLSVAATTTSAQISVSSSVDWTASSDNAAFTVSPASGSGNGTITVNFDENTTTEDRSAVITVATTSDKVSTKSYQVTLTQKGKPSGEELTITAVFDKQGAYGIKGTSKSKTKDSETFTVDGYEFVLAGDGTNGCASYDGYILFGKQGAYIQTPAVEGYTLQSIVITTGAGASTNVCAAVYATDGTTVVSPEQKLDEKGADFTFELSNAASGAAYRLQVTNAYNAQAQKLVLTYGK